jgi:hypothetical protein
MAKLPLAFGDALPTSPILGQWFYLQALSTIAPAAVQELLDIAAGIEDSAETRAQTRLDARSETRLETWATSWHLPYTTSEWMTTIRRHLWHWRRAPECAGAWLSPGSFSLPALPDPPRWSPWEQSKTAYLEAHARYLADVEQAFQQAPARFTDRDLQILVVVIALQRSIHQALEMFEMDDDESTIEKRLRRLAAVLELPWRPARGRPRRR